MDSESYADLCCCPKENTGTFCKWVMLASCPMVVDIWSFCNPCQRCLERRRAEEEQARREAETPARERGEGASSPSVPPEDAPAAGRIDTGGRLPKERPAQLEDAGEAAETIPAAAKAVAMGPASVSTAASRFRHHRPFHLCQNTVAARANQQAYRLSDLGDAEAGEPGPPESLRRDEEATQATG